MFTTTPKLGYHWTPTVRRSCLALVLMVSLVSALATGATTLRPSVMQVQRKLQALGYDTGGADGLIGPRTRQALKAFQEKHNLQVTGIVDEPTLVSLGLVPATKEPAAAELLPPPAAPWRPVLAYLRYADSQPARLVPYVTEHFRQDLSPEQWIAQMLANRTESPPLRLSWQIEHIETNETTEVPRALVYVRSKLRINGQEITRREVFSVVREDTTNWLLDDWRSE